MNPKGKALTSMRDDEDIDLDLGRNDVRLLHKDTPQAPVELPAAPIHEFGKALDETITALEAAALELIERIAPVLTPKIEQDPDAPQDGLGPVSTVSALTAKRTARVRTVIAQIQDATGRTEV